MEPYFSFQWHITEACDQRCKHCYIFAENADKVIESMSWEEMRQTLANIEEFCTVYGRRPYLYLTGGDPILHPDFWRLMDLLKAKKIPFTIMGNPFHLTNAVCKRLHESGCIRYQLSIDGLQKTHDWFRKPGSFQETLAKIYILKQSGIRAIIMTTVSDKNIREIPAIIDTVVKYRTDVFAFARYVPTSAEKNTGIAPLAYRNLLAACDKKFKHYEKLGCETYFNKKDHLWTLYEYETGGFKIPQETEKGVVYAGCHCASGHLTILPNGDIYACRRVAESKVGNVYTDRLKDVWIKECEVYRDISQFSKCSRCKLVAWCRGCPAVAKGTSGNFYGEDPQCWADVDGALAASPAEKASWE